MVPPALPVFHSPLSLLHNPPYEILSGEAQPFFESPDRYRRILEALFPSHARASRSTISAVPRTTEIAPFEEIEFDWNATEVAADWLLEAVHAVHEADYVAFLKGIYREWIAEGGSKAAVLPETFLRQDILLEPDRGPRQDAGAIEKAGRYFFDLSCPITADTWIAALASARVALESAKHLLATDGLPGVFALCRPPGHHSTASLCGGYCYLNNVAITARFLQAQRPGAKVAIVDIDYHHGNGTSKIFYSDPSVLYVSLHGSPDYPYFTGAASEKGAPPAEGTNLNFPLPLGTDNPTYLRTLETARDKIQGWGPDFVAVSLGVDTFIDDPLTDFKITLEAYPVMGRIISTLDVPTVFVMEGGYCLPHLGECVRGVLEGFIAGRSVGDAV